MALDQRIPGDRGIIVNLRKQCCFDCCKIQSTSLRLVKNVNKTVIIELAIAGTGKMVIGNHQVEGCGNSLDRPEDS